MARNQLMHDTDPSMDFKIIEIKKELMKIVKSIVDSNYHSLDSIDSAIRLLSILRESKSSSNLDHLDVPHHFRCPISMDLIRDPVIVASGQTYDRPFIKKWLKEGHRTCPQTKQVLSHVGLTPNYLVRELILEWCKDRGIQLPIQVQDSDVEVLSDKDRDHLKSLLERMSCSLTQQKEAAKELRLLTKKMPSFRALFGESSDAIPQLLGPICRGREITDPHLQEDLITTILNLSIHDSNKKLIVESPLVIPLLIESLKCGTIETKRNAAAALFSLSALDSNKHIIGRSGALKHLIDLLDQGNTLAMKDAASAIFNLCVVVENRGRAVSDGAVGVILNQISDRALVDELLAILTLLSSHHKCVKDMVELGAISILLSIVKESGCERNKENCVAILYTICFYDRSKLKEIGKEEDDYKTISTILQSGTSRAKRKANGILEKLNKVSSITHTA